jgi:hypothetical protein
MPSMVIHLTTHVPESHQVLLTLPPDCPVGELAQEHDAFLRMLPELLT